MKFNETEKPKKVSYHIRVDEDLDREVEKYNINKSIAARKGLRLTVEEAKKAKKK